MVVGMGNVGGKSVRTTVGSMPNKGCIFGSMGGLPSTIGILSINSAIYKKQTSYCNDKCIPTGCKEGFAYLQRKGLITYNKGAGGIGRMSHQPGIDRLFGNGYQRYV